jgi:hypothetical protein
MSTIKPIAIYLPQFHPIPENNEWWGKGFTEWTNVTKAKPYFKGHYQPHLPTELGFYDLRFSENRQAQENLAKENGIYGFCYYHYWFDGKQVLQNPIELKLKNKEENLPFMLCWANENWTRNWDGGNNEILLKQNYSKEDAKKLAKHLIPFFQDERYIKNNGKVLFAIYRSEIIPNVYDYIDEIHNEARANNISVEISRVESFGNSGKQYIDNFNSAIEFQPFSESLKNFSNEILLPRYKKMFFHRFALKGLTIFGKTGPYKAYVWRHFQKIDYYEYVLYLIKNYKFKTSYKRYPCITPSWDNSPRRSKLNTFLFYNSKPEYFELWLKFIINGLTKSEHNNLNGFIFINAWNEWAEGNHLEPCIKYGMGYLEKVKKVV